MPTTALRRRHPAWLAAILLALATVASLLNPVPAHAQEAILPKLVLLERVSPDAVGDWEEVAASFEFDAPVDSVSVGVRDSLGRTHFLTSSPGTSATGVAQGWVVTTGWAGGSVALDSVSYQATVDGQRYGVYLNANGEVTSTYPFDAPRPSTTDGIRFAPFEVESELDLSIPASITSATRISPDTLVNGGAFEIAWTSDQPIENIRFELRDGGGAYHWAEWSSWTMGGMPASEGTARVLIDTASWNAGPVTFNGVSYSWRGSSMNLNAFGDVMYKNPSGLKDAALPAGLDALTFTVESEVDLSVAPKLLNLELLSPAVVGDGEQVVVRWEFDRPVQTVQIAFRDPLGETRRVSGGGFQPATSGEALAVVHTSFWPGGTTVLEGVSYTYGPQPSKWVQLDATGTVVFKSDGVGDIPPAGEAIKFIGFDVTSDIDLSIPPTLSRLERRSPDVLANGGKLEFPFSVDKPISNLSVNFVDSIGAHHSASWNSWETGSASALDGVATATIDTAKWAGGSLTYDGVTYSWPGGSIELDAEGQVRRKYPSGLADAAGPIVDPLALGFMVESDIDLSAMPSLLSITRTSADVLSDRAEVAIDWEFDTPIRGIEINWIDGLGRVHDSFWWGDSGTTATSGTATSVIRAADWAPGEVTVSRVRYWTASDAGISLAVDGSLSSKWPTGVDDPIPYAAGFGDLAFIVDSNVVFETVDVPAPVFTDATCEAPARLKLDDFPHGSWSWSSTDGNSGDGANAFDDEVTPYSAGSWVVTAQFDAGWGTTGESRWTHRYADTGSCEPELTLTSTPEPTVTGRPKVGGKLTVDPGSWEPAPVELSIQWFRNGEPVEGATGPTYKLKRADAGAAITVEVTGAKAGYTPVTTVSDPVTVKQRPWVDAIQDWIESILDAWGLRVG